MGHVSDLRDAGKRCRFRTPPAPVGSERWNQWDEQLDARHVARLIKKSLSQLDLSPLQASYSGRGSAAHFHRN